MRSSFQKYPRSSRSDKVLAGSEGPDMKTGLTTYFRKGYFDNSGLSGILVDIFKNSS